MLEKTGNKGIKGITLIALVITIIVLLILAGISITMLSGDNSILKRAGDAIDSNNESGTKEQIQLQVLGSYDENANLSLKKLKTNLQSIGAIVIADNFPVTAIMNGLSYKIDDKGIVEKQEKVDRTEIKIGDYINYEPDKDYDENNYPKAKIYPKEYLSEKYTGDYDDVSKKYNTTDLMQDNIKWQILKIYEDGSIKIIGKTTSRSIRFWDATGYNNAVWILNNICEELYSKKSLGIIARSVNLEDFEDDAYYENEDKGIWKKSKDNYIKEQILERKTELDKESDYIQSVDTVNNTVTYKKDYSYYPNIYPNENGSGIDKEYIKTNGITSSDKFATSREKLDNSISLNAIKQANNYLTTKYTAYNIKINDLNYGDASKALYGVNFWIASRIVQCDSNKVKFGLYRVMGDSFNFVTSISSDKNIRTQSQSRLRPVVTLGPNVKITPSETASSEDGTPHQITSYN